MQKPPASAPVDQWWTTSILHLLKKLGASPDGLKEPEAHARLQTYGKNVLAERKKPSFVERFLSKLKNPLTLLLLAAATISAGLGQVSDFLIITGILLVSISLDVYQEHQAVEGAEKLRKQVSLTASVVRDGLKKEIPLSHLVPGDIVNVSTGDIIPADGRIVRAENLMIDQSTLTGESVPQAKDPDAKVSSQASVSQRSNSVFMGTNVVAGEATILVVATGGSAELGHIATALVSPRPETEFEKGIREFGMLLTKTALIVSGIVLVTHLFMRHDLLSSLLFVLALAIGFAPELLPVVLTINLSKGAMRMSRKGVIVKSLASIENFGSIEILATDKTGTLTENEITFAGARNIRGKEDEQTFFWGYLNSKFQRGFRGPFEQAVLSQKSPEVSGYRYVSTIPFDFFRKRVSVVVRDKRTHMLIVKGAPEEVLKRSTFRSTDLKQALTTLETFSRQGLRSLAVATRDIGDVKGEPSDEKNLTFIGFLTFQDPPKKSAGESIKLLSAAGIEIKIITGDNELVTEAVCRQLQVPVKGIVRAENLEHLTDSELEGKVREATIFARMNPEEKERVLRVMRHGGKVVGYLGDGINDAPSFRAADIGISVDNAADVAKETADIILLHKSLHVLYEGVIEGRKTFGNVMKYLNMGLSSNFGNMLSIAVSSLFLPFLPLLPIQVLLNDLAYDVSQLMLASDSVDAHYLEHPHKWSIASLRQFMFVFGPASSLFDFLTFGVLLWYFRANAPLFQTSWFVESIVTQTIIVFSIRTHMVPFFRSKPNGWFALGLVAIVIFGLALPFSPIGPLFSFVRPPFFFYLVLSIILASYMMLVELLKLWYYGRHEQ